MFADPIENLKLLDLKQGMQVADLGAGSGSYSLAAGRLVGPKGRVFAIEVQKDLLPAIKKNATEQGVSNVEVVWGDIENSTGTRLRESSVDRVIVSNLLFQVSDRLGLVTEINRITKPNGKVMVVDWSELSNLRSVAESKKTLGGDWFDVSNKTGPRQGSLVAESDAVSLFETAGMSLEKKFNAGDHHYGLIFIKK